MTSKKLLSALMALVFALSLFTALPVSAANGSLVATVGGSTISANAAIPANSTIVFTVPYGLTEDDVAENVVLAESDKAATVTWNLREFSYDLDGDTLTVDFTTGILAMNGSYQFTFKDPAGEGTDVVFPFTTTAVDGYAMYENFERYPVGVIAEGSNTSQAWKPFTRYYMDTRDGHKTEIVKEDNDKFLRLSVATRYQEVNLIGYMTGFSASYSDTYVTGDAEFEFKITPGATPQYSIYEMVGIGILPRGSTYEIYAKTTYSEIATSNSWYNPSDWTLLDTITFDDNAARDAKHTLKIRTTTTTTSNDTRVLNAVEFDDDAIGATVIGDGLAMATGNHGARIQGVLYSQKNANKHSMTLGILNGGAGGGGSMDVYSIKYSKYVPAPVTVVTAPSDATISARETAVIEYTFSKAINASSISNSTVVLEKQTGSTWTAVNIAQYAALDENDKTQLTITIPQGVLTASTNYKLSLKAGLTAVDGGALTEPTPYLFETEALPAATLTASKETGSTISQTETLTFTSDLPLALEDANLASVITLTEKVKAEGIVGTTTSLSRVLPAMTISADKKTITIAFPSGHLAPNTEYTITIADTIKTAEGGAVNGTGAYVYTTAADDGYYINDSFERYTVGTYSGGYSQPHTPAEATMAPWAKFYGSSSTWVWRHKLVENNGDKALSLEIQSGYSGYGWLAYHNAYAAPAPTNASMVSGTFEIDFEIKGTATTTFEINDIILTQDAEGTAYNMYVRTEGALAGRGTEDQYVLLDSFAAPTGTAARYTLKYDIRTNAKDSYLREITKVSITLEGGQEKVISLPGGRVAISLNGRTGNMDGAINYDGDATEYTKIFGIGDTTVAAADALPTLNIYSIKYAPSGVTVQVAEGATTGAMDITITNKGETLNAVIALAVYDGNQLVGVAGLGEGVTTIESGAPMTVTKTVPDAVAGNTYKVIFLNNEDALQPLWFSASGTIE